MVVPKVEMSFASENDAYGMYNTYADTIRFSISKSVIKHRADKTIYSRVIICSSQGHAEMESSHATTRTGRKALVKFTVGREEIWTYCKKLNLNTIIF